MLYFIRHAESTANMKDILASRLDFPLSEKGFSDARKIAAAFTRNVRLDRIISSPLLRAKQTAEVFAREANLEVEIHTALIEQHLGRFSGMNYHELENHADYEHDRARRWDWIPAGGGESYAMIAERLRPFFEELSHGSQQHVLVVTHAVTLRLVRALLENTIPAYPKEIAKNGEIWETEFYGLGIRHHIRSLFPDESAMTSHRE